MTWWLLRAPINAGAAARRILHEIKHEGYHPIARLERSVIARYQGSARFATFRKRS